MAKKPFFCDECSTRNTPDSKYCKECGAQIHVSYQTQALSDYDRIDDPTDQERLTQFLDMAFWHNEAGNVDAAVRACNAALAINPNSTTALSLLGSLYEKQGEDALAIAQFEHVLALNPDSEADRFKLLQLQEGVHIKPVRPSPVYRWLPPAFGAARFSGLAQAWADRPRPDMTLLPVKPTPALAAAGLAVLVLAGSLFLIKPPAPEVAAGTVPAAVLPAARSAFGTASLSPTALPGASLPKPILMLPERPPTPLIPAPAAVASVPPRDPFAGTVPEPLTYEPPVTSARPADSVRASRASSGRLSPLPPLVAVPLPPAPVSVPTSLEANAPISPDSEFARHTVVVDHLGGLSEFGGPGMATTAAPGSDVADSVSQDTTPGPPSRIQITVDPSTDSASSASAPPSGDSSASAGESAQQSAFALQQQGKYRQAAAAYQQAIRAYQAQITAGEDRDAAERGLQASQTGLQICQQNQ